MIRYRNAAAVLAVAASTTMLAACGPTGSPAAAPSSAASSSATSPSAASPTLAPPTEAASLAALLQASTSRIRSAHVDITMTAPGFSIIGSGDETAVSGRMQTLDFTATDPELGPVRGIIAEGHTYLRVPMSISHARKPWILATFDSRHTQVQQLATTMQSMQRAATLNPFAAFSDGATVMAHDRENLTGGQTTHYSLSVDIKKLPESADNQKLLTAGVTGFPIEMWLDDTSRLVKFTQNLEVRARQASIVVTVGNFDAPVTITPPPADQVSTD